MLHLVPLTSKPLQVRIRLDLTAALRLPSAPANERDQHRVTSLITRNSQIYSCTYSGCLIQVQIGIGAASLRPAILQEYVALETKVRFSERNQDDQIAVEDQPNEVDELTGDTEPVIKMSYSPTTISAIALAKSDAIYSACGDGTIRVQHLTQVEPSTGSQIDSRASKSCLLNHEEYNDTGYLPSCVGVAVCKEQNLLVSVDANSRLCLWNLSAQTLLGVTSMEGIRDAYRLYLNPQDATITVFSSDMALIWSYKHVKIPDA